MNKFYKILIELVIIFLADNLFSAEKHSHSAPDLGHPTDTVISLRKSASCSQLPRPSYEQQMAIVVRDTMLQREKLVEDRKKNHKLSESGLFANMEEIERDITCSLIFLLSAFNVYQSFQSLTIPEFGIGILGLCGLTCLSIKQIHKADDEHQKKFGVAYGRERKEPVPSFWYQSQYVYYGVLGALFCASLINFSEHGKLAYLITLGCFNGMLSTWAMTFLNALSVVKAEDEIPFPMLYRKLNKDSKTEPSLDNISN